MADGDWWELADPRARAWGRMHAANPPAWVYVHCRCVEALADAMVTCMQQQGHAVDRDVVRQGALMHDIGRARTQDISHAVVGVQLLREDGPGWWDERVLLCIERHTGAGLDAAEAASLGLPPKDYTPQTLEEKIVAHADNLYTGPRRLTLPMLEEKYEQKDLGHILPKFRRLHTELESYMGVQLDTLEPSVLPEP